ncbi:hypothetical protein CP974_07375 [Streptomyces fradiae ATCC 10745 = DSM 40063]|nr:hypothetical protein CP974_07375 [Streptomyces fradiae ATCC 10745 = DSM 40063]
MPSLTVVFSSDTDICFSPGLFGDCLPTVATGGVADSFRAAPGRTPSCSHTASGASTGLWDGELVTSTLWTSSK